MMELLRWLERQPGEPPQKPNPFKDAKSALLSWVEQLSQWFVNHLMMDTEPQVWYTCDLDGNLWWNADDPITGRSLRHLSEAEMRAWLEQRHYQIEG